MDKRCTATPIRKAGLAYWYVLLSGLDSARLTSRNLRLQLASVSVNCTNIHTSTLRLPAADSRVLCPLYEVVAQDIQVDLG